MDNENSEELKQLFSGKANIRLQTLWGENKECYNVVQWLRMNQSCFQRTIIEPMILVVSKTPVLGVLCYVTHRLIFTSCSIFTS